VEVVTACLLRMGRLSALVVCRARNRALMVGAWCEVLYDGLRCCCKFRCLVIVRQHFAPERMRTALFARFSTKQWVGDRKDTAT